MLNKIQVLDNNLIDKIAAGEVIERPASIVKELVENSIDAGAKNISVEIKKGGISYIKITDDGSGIESSQVDTAFLRHATSKLKEFEEIGSILTLGFRGEALSSIASVSQLEMITKTKEESTGTKIVIHGGNIISKESYPSANGTTFIIKNVFYNTPVRRKFLKKDSVESGYISDIINRFALGNPQISFKYINNSSVMLNTNGNNDLKTAIFYVYGKEIASKMIEIKNSKENFTLSGYLCSPEVSRGNRSYANLFINGRYVKSKLIQDAIEEALEGKLMVGKFPIYVLNIKTPKDTVDINVHPTKMEVRFTNDIFIFDFIKQSILKSLKSAPIPEFSTPSTKLSDITKKEPYTVDWQKDLENVLLNSAPSNNVNKTNFAEPLFVMEEPICEEPPKEDTPKSFNVVEDFYNKNTINTIFNKFSENTELLEEDFSYSPNPIFENENCKEEPKENIAQNVKNIFNNYKIIGQLFNTYWIVEKDNNMYMIDQHALHEKYLYESFINSAKKDSIPSQKLLSPCTIKVTELEDIIIKENLNLLNSFGFKFEDFGLNTYVIREVPFIFNAPLSPEFFTEIVDILADKSISSIYELKLDKIASISCKSAIKGNDKISIKEAEKMLDYVLNLENPFNCPHGRPTIIKFSKYEIEKMFKRIQH